MNDKRTPDDILILIIVERRTLLFHQFTLFIQLHLRCLFFLFGGCNRLLSLFNLELGDEETVHVVLVRIVLLRQHLSSRMERGTYTPGEIQTVVELLSFERLEPLYTEFETC